MAVIVFVIVFVKAVILAVVFVLLIFLAKLQNNHFRVPLFHFFYIK